MPQTPSALCLAYSWQQQLHCLLHLLHMTCLQSACTYGTTQHIPKGHCSDSVLAGETRWRQLCLASSNNTTRQYVRTHVGIPSCTLQVCQVGWQETSLDSLYVTMPCTAARQLLESQPTNRLQRAVSMGCCHLTAVLHWQLVAVIMPATWNSLLCTVAHALPCCQQVPEMEPSLLALPNSMQASQTWPTLTG